jgi:hypothetical protein
VERRRGNLKFHCPAHETASSLKSRATTGCSEGSDHSKRTSQLQAKSWQCRTN